LSDGLSNTPALPTATLASLPSLESSFLPTVIARCEAGKKLSTDQLYASYGLHFCQYKVTKGRFGTMAIPKRDGSVLDKIELDRPFQTFRIIPGTTLGYGSCSLVPSVSSSTLLLHSPLSPTERILLDLNAQTLDLLPSDPLAAEMKIAARLLSDYLTEWKVKENVQISQILIVRCYFQCCFFLFQTLIFFFVFRRNLELMQIKFPSMCWPE
jgi:hypothetical protein